MGFIIFVAAIFAIAFVVERLEEKIISDYVNETENQ